MKKILIIILFFFISCGNNSCPDFSRYKTLMKSKDSDKKITEVKEKIDKEEKNNVKDVKSINHLADLYYQLGNLYIDKQLWDQAIDSFQRSMQYGKTSASVYYSVGLGYANRGNKSKAKDDIENAESYYNKALKIDNKFYEARYALALLLFYEKDEKDKGISLVEDVIVQNKKYYIARFALARMHYEMQNPEKALSLYEDLYTDIEKLPDSTISREYKKRCKDNITRLMEELSRK